jgi:hypothetical protein
MKIDSINPGVKINRPAPSRARRIETPDESRSAAPLDFKSIVQKWENRKAGDLRRLTPLSDDEKKYLAKLFSTENAPFSGYDVTRKPTEHIAPGMKLDIEI